MAYRFAGFFARPMIERPAALPGTVVWREITVPFVGVGVRLPVTGFGDDEPVPAEAGRLLAEVGLNRATDWVYLNYVTWAGRIDSVYGLGSSGGREFGPVSESDGDKTRTAYLALMDSFGVSQADALNFPPFVRGFWGE
jgi:hypothetical protein